MGASELVVEEYGIDVITPAVVARPVWSASWSPSIEDTEGRFECRDDFEPLRLGALRLGAAKLLKPVCNSSRPSLSLSLWYFLPKNERPPDDCLDALSFIEGMFVSSSAPADSRVMLNHQSLVLTRTPTDCLHSSS